MLKQILRTFTSDGYPEITLKKGNKLVYALIGYVLVKKVDSSVSQDQIKNKFDKLIVEKSFSADRSYYSESKNPFIKAYINNKLIIDFIFLKDLENQIKKDEEKALDYLKKELEEDNRLLTIFNDINENSQCNILKKILDNTSNILFLDKYKDLITIDVDLIDNFIEKYDIREQYNTNNLRTYDDVIKEAKNIILYQENLSFFEVLEDYFFDMNTILYKPNEIKNLLFSKSNFKTSFLELEKANNRDFLLLKGNTGSGKSILALKLSLKALDHNYYSKFIPIFENTELGFLPSIKNLEEESKEKSLFVVFDGIHYLNDQEINTLLNSVEDKDAKSIVIFTYNPEKIKNIRTKNKLNKDFTSIEIQPQKHDFLKTPLDQVIFEQLQRKLDNVYDLYYAYTNKIMEENASELNFSLLELRKIFQSYAYKTLFGKVRVDFSKFNDDKLLYFFRDNMFTNIENELEYLNFKSELFQKVLASEYILSEYLSSEDFSFDLEVDQANLIDSKWKFIMLYIAHFLNNTNKEKLNSKKELIRGILHHLLQKRDFEKHKEILNLVKDKELSKNYNKMFKIQLSKNYYNNGDYINSIKQSLSALETINTYSDDDIKLINHLSSCAIDLFLPKIGLSLTEKIVNIADDAEKARIFGNTARGFIKIKEFDKALNLFISKLKIHESSSNDLIEDILRDKADLLMLYGLKNESNIDQILLFNEIIEKYNQLEKENYVTYDVNKSFAYRSLSYSINIIPDIIFEQIPFFDKLTKKDTSAEIIFYYNIGKYYFDQKNYSLAKDNLLKALKISEKYNYKAESYVIKSYLYLITNEITYKEKALNYYYQLEEEANFMKNLLKDSTLLDNIEESFGLENLYTEKSDFESIILI